MCFPPAANICYLLLGSAGGDFGKGGSWAFFPSMIGCWQTQFCAGNHRCIEIKSTVVMWCSDGSFVSHSIPSYTLKFFLSSLPWCSLKFGEGDIKAPSMAGFSTVSYSQHLELRVSQLPLTPAKKQLFWPKVTAALIYGYKCNHLDSNLMGTSCASSQTVPVAFPLVFMTYLWRRSQLR